MMRVLLLCALLPVAVLGHGRLLLPVPRQCAEGKCVMEDPDMPLNDGKTAADDAANHPFNQNFVCRVAGMNRDKSVPVIKITAGGTVDMKWVFTAKHPGDGGLFVSYDDDWTSDIRSSMKFFKIANFPQMRRDSGKTVKVHLPDWLPAGKAVLRWDWYALHNDPDVEFYTNCIDVEIVSSSNLTPADMQPYSYPITIARKSTGSNKFACRVEASNLERSCAKGPYADVHAYPGNNLIGNGNYRNIYDPTRTYFISGPQCVTGVAGNCCQTSTGSMPHQFNINGYQWVGSNANSGGGFNTCKDSGSSGPAPGAGSSPATPTTDKPAAPTNKPTSTPTKQPKTSTQAPAPPASPKPTGTCVRECRTEWNDDPWSEKCTWEEDCDGCSECHGGNQEPGTKPTPTGTCIKECAEWTDDPWSERCTWDECDGCSQCRSEDASEALLDLHQLTGGDIRPVTGADMLLAVQE